MYMYSVHVHAFSFNQAIAARNDCLAYLLLLTTNKLHSNHLGTKN